jgi:flavin-binding protein dodecin
MSVARVTEITSSSPTSFDDAIRVGLARANKTLENVTGAWIKAQEVLATNGRISEYRVRMRSPLCSRPQKPSRDTPRRHVSCIRVVKRLVLGREDPLCRSVHPTTGWRT